MPQSNPPPSLPEVRDEAANSPGWLPALGLGLLVLLALLVGSRFMTHRAPPTAAPRADDAVQVQAAALPTRV